MLSAARALLGSLLCCFGELLGIPVVLFWDPLSWLIMFDVPWTAWCVAGVEVGSGAPVTERVTP